MKNEEIYKMILGFLKDTYGVEAVAESTEDGVIYVEDEDAFTEYKVTIEMMS